MNHLDGWDGRLRRQRIVELDADIDSDRANRLTAQILVLSSDDPAADIRMCVNSHGGLVSAGLTVYDTMRLVACDVATCASGTAAGMAQFLLSPVLRASPRSCPAAGSA